MFAAINGVFIATKEGATEVLVQTDCLAVVHLFEGVTVQESIKNAFVRAKAKAVVRIAHVVYRLSYQWRYIHLRL